MSTYNPEIKIFYGPKDSDHRLIPAPNITISLEFSYANDTIIGYSYIVNLTGSITALDLRSLNNGDELPNQYNDRAGGVIDHIHNMRKILTQNGNILHIVNGIDNSHILKAKGGILRSFTINESPNNWTSYAGYSASLEFNSIDFLSSTENCGSIFLDPSTYNTDGIVDIGQYKIKSFQDSWSFTFNEEESFNKVKIIDDQSSNLNIDNHSFNIQYSISATGKHFFVYSNENTGASNLLPAWEQAKNFVQYRMYNQVTNLINMVLKDSYNSACTSSDSLDDILEPGSNNGLLKGLNDNNYKIFNELITTEASESDGTFSATYSATVKTILGNNSWSSPETKHTIKKSITTTNANNIPITNISINGTIEGLIEGGLIRINQPLNLPSNGTFIINNSQTITKYDNAKNLLDKIYSDNDYNNGIGENGKRDLKPIFKNILGITLENLNITNYSNIPNIDDPPHPISFNLTHDYNAGTINYSIEYSSNKACGRKFNNITIQTNNPNKIIAVFNIPNSNNCPLVQELGTFSAKIVNINIQGVDLSDIGQPPNLDLVQEVVQTLSLNCFTDGYLPITLPPPGTYIITQKQYNKNPIDGSFTINIGYICGTQGCTL